ncbi:MAG: hypothetical protein ACI38A_07980 [Candidatus Ornithomonoglobus sp.]
MKHKTLKITLTIIAALTVLLTTAWFTVPVCKTTNNVQQTYEEICSKYTQANYTVSVLNYGGNTGACWNVEDSTDSSLIGKCAALKAFINPRFQRANRTWYIKPGNYFYLDTDMIYIIVSDNPVETVDIDGEEVPLLNARKIIIGFDNAENGSSFKMKDFGIDALLAAILNPWGYWF